MRELIGRLISMLAMINIAEAVNVGRESGFKDIEDQLGAYQWSAILDTKTCPICRRLDGLYFEIGDPSIDIIKPPIHPGCRCILVGVMKEELNRFPVRYAYLTAGQVDAITVNKFW